MSASEDGTARGYACEFCGWLDDLLALARARTFNPLTPEHRQRYRHEQGAKCPGA